MAEPTYYLSEADREILREVIAAHRSKRNRNRFRRRERQVMTSMRPVELISAWTQEDEDSEWTARARPLLYVEDGSWNSYPIYRLDADVAENPDGTYDDEIVVHAPLCYAWSGTYSGGPPPPPDIGGARRVMVQQRGRWELINVDPSWIPATLVGSTDCPAHGIVTSADVTDATNGDDEAGRLLTVKAPFYDASSGYINAGRQFFVNGASRLALDAGASDDNTYGVVNRAAAKPVRALYSSSGGYTPDRGELWGPAPNSYALWKGLPGFECVGGYCGDDYTTFVIARPEAPFWVRATQDYLQANDGVICNPVLTGPGGSAYDGAGGRPEIKVFVECPKVPQNVSVSLHKRAWNIHESDDFLAWPQIHGDGYGFAADPSMLDDPIGTVKAWVGSTSYVPAGWRQYTGWDSYDVIGLDGGISAISGTAGGDNLADVARVYWIERVACNIA